MVELPKLLWLPILYCIVLPLRAKRVAAAYSEIWLEEGSPLKVITQKQAAALRERLQASGYQVEYAMSYSEPGLAEVVDNVLAAGAERLLLLPLYPQYSATTTATIYDQLTDIVRKRRALPSLEIISSYHSHPLYIKALAATVREHRKNYPPADVLVFSFHGIPKVNVSKGDPYEQHCEMTASLVANELGLSDQQWQLCYQSRFGKQEWLQPYTSEVLQELGKQSLSVEIICPAFAADCLETLEEIAGENKELFVTAGGKSFHYIPCLNDRIDHIDLLESLVLKK